jgi:hypothetical protein
MQSTVKRKKQYKIIFSTTAHTKCVVDLPHFVMEIEYSLERNTICHRKRLPVRERNCHRKKLPVTRRNFQLREETSCHRKTLPVTERNLLPHEEMEEHNSEEEMEIVENVSLLQNAYKIFKNGMNNHFI